MKKRRLHIEYAHDDDADEHHQDGDVMLDAQLLLEENAAPKHGGGAVGGDDRGAHGDVRAVRQRIDVEELADGLADRADILRRFGARGQLLALDEEHIRAADQTRGEEGQLVGDVGGILVQGFEHKAVRERAGRVQNAVGNREQQR